MYTYVPQMSVKIKNYISVLRCIVCHCVLNIRLNPQIYISFLQPLLAQYFMDKLGCKLLIKMFPSGGRS